MTAPTVSVIIVSRGRPAQLSLCLTGLDQLSYPRFEVIVVADQASREGLGRYVDRVKLVPFEVPNISAARNAGARQAAGEIIAFIDDDAVAEPTWLTHLTAPFAQDDVAITGGYVIGRNGISYQWTARMVFADGNTAPMPLTGDQATILPAEPGRAIKTEGTNMAVRRSVLDELGGFDEAFEFYLDETDLNMRIAAAGHKTAIVPLAQVHHGFAASARRSKTRVPRDLSQIAASTAVFQRKHGADLTPVESRAAQRDRLLRLMVGGFLAPGDVRRLLKGFDTGWAKGLSRDVEAVVDLKGPSEVLPFQATHTARPHRVIWGRFWQARDKKAAAKAAVAEGAVVSLYLMSFSALFHRCRFHSDGYWLQSGGQFGKSDRSGPLLQFWRAKTRTKREKDRIAAIRVPKMPSIQEKSPY